MGTTETTSLADIGISFHRRYIFNCYVVEDGGAGAPVVVDPGTPSTAGAAGQALRELGADRAILAATHAHSDHVAGIPQLLESFSADVVLPARVQSYVDGETPRTPALREILQILPVLLEPGLDWGAIREAISSGRDAGFGVGPFRVPGRIDGLLSDGETVPGAPDWEVLVTPGHTDCSTSFWNARTRTLLSGDAVLTYGGRAWFTPETTDPALAERTERRLRALPVEHLLPGHGLPVSGPNVMGEALSSFERPRGWPIFRGHR